MRGATLNPEHWVEIVIAGCAVLAPSIVWGFSIERRVAVLERIRTEEMSNLHSRLARLDGHLDRVEEKVTQISLRCAAFQPFHERRAQERRQYDDGHPNQE